MDEIELIEKQRYGLFALAALMTGFLTFVLLKDFLAALLVGVTVGLLVSGLFVAKALMQPHVWAILEGEARYHGTTVTKRGVWMGNLIPFAVGLLATAWWLNSR